MNTVSTANEILSLEKKYWQAIKDSDVETALSLTRFPCIVTSSQGAMHVSEPEYKKMMQSNDPKRFKDAEMANPKVEVVNEETAIISYSLKVNGMNMIDLSTWIKMDGNWLCASHTETPEIKNLPRH